MGRIMDLTTLFLALLIGCGVGGLILVVECWVNWCDGEKVEEFKPRKIKRQRMIGILSSLEDNDELLDEIYDKSFKKIEEV